MADNWKSLADMLGTPSIDPIEPKRAAWPPKPAASEPVGDGARGVHPPERPATNHTAPEPESSHSEERPASASRPERSKLKSTWDAVAAMFGVAAGDEERTEPSSPRGEEPSSRRPQREESHDRGGRRSEPAAASDDLDALLANFRSPPAKEPEPAVEPRAVRAAEPEARPRRGERGERSERGERGGERGRPRRDEADRSESRPAGGRGETGSAESSRGEVGRSPGRRGDGDRQRSGWREDETPSTKASAPAPARAGFADDIPPGRAQAGFDGEDDDAPQRRSPRRRSRRARAQGDEAAAPVDAAPSDTADIGRDDADQIAFEPADDVRRGPRQRVRRVERSWGDEPARERSSERSEDLDRGEPRRSEPRRGESVRGESVRGESVRGESVRGESVRGESVRGDVGRDTGRGGPRDDRDEDASADSSEAGRTRRRRRRRGAGGGRADETLEETTSSGRQIYGRHMDDEGAPEDGEEMSSVTDWKSAISVLVDKNIENHRHTQPYRRRGGSGGR